MPVSGAILGGLLLTGAAVRPDGPLLDRWFAAQAGIKTWTAQFTQIRTLKALKEPLRAEGRVWFAAPNQFRWELGEPPRTIAVREAAQMMVVYPRFKRAERYPLDGDGASQWRDALTLIETGMPRSRAALEERFTEQSFSVTDGVATLRLQPRSSQARRMIGEVRIEFSEATLALGATELHFADGSVLRNEFRAAEVNPELPPDHFKAPLGEGYKVKEPLAGRGR